ncbi:MAG: response regulator transcription factor [Smithellaceae bacterium]
MKIKKILIVDDETMILSYLERKLIKLDYSVCLASDGEEAVRQAFLHIPDIILLDIKLPKLNGIEVCKMLKTDERTKSIPILMLSARAQSSEIKIGLEAGADKYLCKPMSFPDILNEIHAYEKK